VESIDDIVEELTVLNELVREARGALFASGPPATLNDREWAIWQNLSDTPTPIDDLIIATGLPTAQILATLSTLEMRRVIRRVSGAFVERLAHEAVLGK
jgi:DNA processing protein